MSLQDLTPQLRTRLNKVERAVGWFVFLASALLVFGFGYYIYHTAERKGWFKTKAQFVTYVQSSAGLKVGDPIYLMGFQVGNITLVHPRPPGDVRHVEVKFEVLEPYFRYIWSRGSYVKVNSGFLGQSQLEVTRGTNGYALCVTQPIYCKTIPELEQLVAAQPGEWQLSQYVFDAQSNVIFKPYYGLTQSNLEFLASLNLPSNSVFAYNNKPDAKPIVAVWSEPLQRYDFYNRKASPPVELTSMESVPVAERLDKLVTQVEIALPNILSLTNKISAVLDNAASATSNLNNTLVATQPLVTNANALVISANTNLNLLTLQVGATLENLANITSNLNVQVQANSNMLAGISKAVIDADDLVQGLKRHWLLRSAFKNKKPPAPTK
jgi:hypothetical protein